jgi:hypothetical protein
MLKPLRNLIFKNPIGIERKKITTTGNEFWLEVANADKPTYIL